MWRTRLLASMKARAWLRMLVHLPFRLYLAVSPLHGEGGLLLKNAHASLIAMIRTIYTDTKGLLDILRDLRARDPSGRTEISFEPPLRTVPRSGDYHCGQPRKSATKFSRRYPSNSSIRAIKVEGSWILLHARIEGL